MIEIKQLESNDLGQFHDLISPSLKVDLLDHEGKLIPHAFFLGAVQKGTPLGILAGIRQDTIMEILDLSCIPQLLEPVGRRLLSALKALAGLEGAELLLWSYSAAEAELPVYDHLLSDMGWAKPERQETLLEVDTRVWDLDDRLKAHTVSGKVMQLTDVPLELQLDFLSAHRDDPQGDFTQYSPLIPELSLAYVENGKMLGYLAAVRGYQVPELAGGFLPEDKAAIGALITHIAKLYEAQEAQRLIVRVHSEMGRKLCSILFRDKLISEQIRMDTELQLRQEVQA